MTSPDRCPRTRSSQTRVPVKVLFPLLRLRRRTQPLRVRLRCRPKIRQTIPKPLEPNTLTFEHKKTAVPSDARGVFCFGRWRVNLASCASIPGALSLHFFFGLCDAAGRSQAALPPHCTRYDWRSSRSFNPRSSRLRASYAREAALVESALEAAHLIEPAPSECASVVPFEGALSIFSIHPSLPAFQETQLTIETPCRPNCSPPDSGCVSICMKRASVRHAAFFEEDSDVDRTLPSSNHDGSITPYS